MSLDSVFFFGAEEEDEAPNEEERENVGQPEVYKIQLRPDKISGCVVAPIV